MEPGRDLKDGEEDWKDDEEDAIVYGRRRKEHETKQAGELEGRGSTV